MNSLFCFGFGYTAEHLARTLPAGWQIGGTVRHQNGKPGTQLFGEALDLSPITHLLISIPPEEAGDPALLRYRHTLESAKDLRWIGYLSTTGVYGDHGGAVVDENTPTAPTSERSRRRVVAEQEWLTFGAERGIPVQIFRLAGIYGPGRNALEDLKEGTAKRIIRPGQLFSRIHVEDIAAVLRAALITHSGSAIYNVCDDEPAPPAEVVSYAAGLLGVEPPPEIPFEQAALSPMALSFWADNKRVDNRRIKEELGVGLQYPSYREGLKAIQGAINRETICKGDIRDL